MWNLVSVRLDTVFVSVQERCTVCAKCPIGSEIVLDSPNGANLTQDRCMVCVEYTIGSEIILEAPDGTPR